MVRLLGDSSHIHALGIIDMNCVGQVEERHMFSLLNQEFLFEMTNYNHCAYLVQALDYFKDQHRLQLRKCENTHETLMGYAYSTFAQA